MNSSKFTWKTAAIGAAIVAALGAGFVSGRNSASVAEAPQQQVSVQPENAAQPENAVQPEIAVQPENVVQPETVSPTAPSEYPVVLAPATPSEPVPAPDAAPAAPADFTQADAERVALAHVGSGRVTWVELEDDHGARWEVEVTLPNGREVDVYVAADGRVVRTNPLRW